MPFSGRARRNIASDGCTIRLALRVIRPRIPGNPAMIRSRGAIGFDGGATPVASLRLIHAVAASLAIGGLSLCLVVTITVLSISMAMPLPV